MADRTIRTETILDELVAGTREALAARQRAEPLVALIDRARSSPLPLPFAPALRGERVRLIAEIKRASPAAGMLEPRFDPVGRAHAYVRGGASAISILTEERRFLGSLADLTAVRDALALQGGQGRPPLLRKDFLVDPYQLHEARAAGADAVLLIVAILERQALQDFLGLAAELRLGALVEVHDEDELERAVDAGARVIGINNRDLRTFTTSLAVTERLRPLIPEERIVVSESGIRDRADVERLAAAGVDAVLVGESLMRSGDVVESVRDLAGVVSLRTANGLERRDGQHEATAESYLKGP